MTKIKFEDQKEAELERKLAESFKESIEVARALDRGELMPHAMVVKGRKLEELFVIMTPKRLQLLKLSHKKILSISELAKATKRDASAVSKDVGKLADFGLVTIVEEVNAGHGTKKTVRPAVDEISFTLA